MSVLLLLVASLILGGIVMAGVFYGWEPVRDLATVKWREYQTWADAELKLLFSPMRAAQLAQRQALFAAVGLLSGIFLLDSYLYGVAFAAVGAYLPILLVKRDRSDRKRRLEEQLDSTLQSLANTILVTQNLEDAFDTIARQFDPPIAQEADFLVKQVRLGMPMDEALRTMSDRIKSRHFDALVTALTIGRQTGGELPKVLETTAGVLRETMRVEGMMQAKTAEGKAQGLVMGLLPVIFGGALQIIDPEWMRPLFHDPIGWAILTLVCILEVAGVALIRKVSRIEV